MNGCGRSTYYVHHHHYEAELCSSPMRKNPNYKGKWVAPFIDNPAYKGPWAPRKISNPKFFEDEDPVKSLDKIVSSNLMIVSINTDVKWTGRCRD